MITKDWPAKSIPKALLIGHDPRLQKSETRADYALFADYFFRNEIPTAPAEKQKYGLAKASFDQIRYLTSGKIAPESVYVTNLCNSILAPAKGKTVYIPHDKDQEGLDM